MDEIKRFRNDIELLKGKIDNMVEELEKLEDRQENNIKLPAVVQFDDGLVIYAEKMVQYPYFSGTVLFPGDSEWKPYDIIGLENKFNIEYAKRYDFPINDPNPNGFPKLMISDDNTIILATQCINHEISGTAMRSNSDRYVGYFSDDWSEELFVDYHAMLSKDF